MFPVLLLILLGCTTSSSCQNSKQKSAPLPLLVFQKTSCYGPCPVYEATIMEDGTITFVGLKHVPVQDSVQVCLPQQELQQLKSDIRALNVSALSDSYLTEWTDVPSTYFTFFENGKQVKRIKHQKGGPEALPKLRDDLEERIFELVKQKAKQP